MSYSWYTFKREDRADFAFLSLKQRGETTYSRPVQFGQSASCDTSLLRLPHLTGFLQWRLSESDRGYRLKTNDRTLRLLGFGENEVKNASVENWPS